MDLNNKTIDLHVVRWIHGNSNGNILKYPSKVEEYRILTSKYTPKSRRMWSADFGVQLVRLLLIESGVTIYPPKKYGDEKTSGDFETHEAVWKVKTRTWMTTGSAGEKILGAPIRYSEIPRLSGKKFNLVSVAYQEYESIHKFQLYNERLSSKTSYLTLLKGSGFSYIRCSTLYKKVQYKLLFNQVLQEFQDGLQDNQ